MKGLLATLIFMTITFVMFTRTVPGSEPLYYRLKAELVNLERLR
jgi:hypothetical protein